MPRNSRTTDRDTMTATTLPTSRVVTQDWNQDFEWLNGTFYPQGFYSSVGWYGHNGIDYGCWEGDPVEAVCDGVIEFAGWGDNHDLLTYGGNAVLLRNDDLGVRFEYLHLSGFAVAQGQQVKRGQVIAYSGNTGTSTAPHLHIGAIPIHGVNVNNGYRGRVDPTPFLYGPLNPDYAPKPTTPQEPFTMAQFDELKGFHSQSHAKLNNIAKAVNANATQNRAWHAASHGKLNALTNAVAQLTEKTGVPISAEQIRQWSKEGAAEALAEGIVTVDVTVQGKEAA
jgi:hypothetical protein